MKRLEDVLPEEDYVLHASYWWKVLGKVGDTGALDLEIAGPSSPRNPETAVLVGDEGHLVVTASYRAGLQFQDGVLSDVPWPCCGLIYVKNARMRGPETTLTRGYSASSPSGTTMTGSLTTLPPIRRCNRESRPNGSPFRGEP